MELRDFYLERQKAELPAFQRVLKAIPADKMSYKPHDRSPSTEQLAWTVVAELKPCLDLIREGRAEWQQIPAPPLEEMVVLFDRWSKELADAVSKMDEADWTKKGQFYYEGKLVSEQPVGQFLWFILFDAIHHRGQLSAYLRPMGSKVPSIYGPSADEPSAM